MVYCGGSLCVRFGRLIAERVFYFQFGMVFRVCPNAAELQKMYDNSVKTVRYIFFENLLFCMSIYLTYKMGIV